MGREELERELKEREAKCQKGGRNTGERKRRVVVVRGEKRRQANEGERREGKGKGRKREKRCDEKRKRGEKEKGEREIKSGITTPPRSKPGAGGGGWRRSRRNYSVWQCRNVLAFSPSVRRPCDLQLPWLLTLPRIWCRR